MYKIYIEYPAVNESTEYFTSNSSEALDLLLDCRQKISNKYCKWVTDFISIMIPTHDINEAMDILMHWKVKRTNEDMQVSNGRCVVNHIETKYSYDKIPATKILNSMQLKNKLLDSLMNKLKLKILK